MFERIHNTKEQICFYERAENHKAKERLFESLKWANFPGKHPDAGADQGFLKRGFVCIKYVGFALWIFLFFLNILWNWNNLVSSRPNYFIFIEYLLAGRFGGEPWTPPGFATPNHLLRTKQCWPLQVIELSEYLFKGHYLKNSLIWMFYPSALLTVRFSAHFILCHGAIRSNVIRLYFIPICMWIKTKTLNWIVQSNEAHHA